MLTAWTPSILQRDSSACWTSWIIGGMMRVCLFFLYILATAHDTFSDGHRAKKAKCVAANMPGPSNNQELRRLQDGSLPPPWYLKQQSIWVQAMNHVSHVNLKEQQSPQRFTLPA